MVQKPKAFADVQSDILTALSASGIRQLSPGGKARAFGDIVADQISGSEARTFANIGATLLPYATGTSLDLIGEIYGVPRIQATTASTPDTDSNFRFYVKSGTFGSINNGLDISIPDNVRILTDSSSGPVYLTDAVTLPATATQQYFSARSLYSGESGNVASQVFTKHNFTAYASSRYGSLLVTNDYGVVGGRDEEDDESYRYRIRLKLQGQNGANEAALRFDLLQIPGIQDVVFDRKAGTFLCYVYAITPVAAASLISDVQTMINDRVAFPLTGTAVNPDLVGISLATTIQLVAGSTADDKKIAINKGVAAVEDYLNNLAIGEVMVINEIADRIRSSSDKILDVGQPNQPLDEIYIWRSRSDATRYSRSLIANLSPATGERLIVEDITNAITLTAV